MPLKRTDWFNVLWGLFSLSFVSARCRCLLPHHSRLVRSVARIVEPQRLVSLPRLYRLSEHASGKTILMCLYFLGTVAWEVHAV